MVVLFLGAVAIYNRLVTNKNMVIDPSGILTREDMEKERTPEELYLWVEKKLADIFNCPEVKENSLLRRGLYKKFYEEVSPLSLFVNILYPKRSDIRCIPNLGNENYDSIIRDYFFSPPLELKVEFTQALDKKSGLEEYLRMKYFLEHRHVSSLGPVFGTKKTDKINVIDEPVNRNDYLAKIFRLIRLAAEAKSRKIYGPSHILIIIINDYLLPRFDSDRDRTALYEFVRDNVITLNFDFSALYVMGISGKTFLPFHLTLN